MSANHARHRRSSKITHSTWGYNSLTNLEKKKPYWQIKEVVYRGYILFFIAPGGGSAVNPMYKFPLQHFEYICQCQHLSARSTTSNGYIADAHVARYYLGSMYVNTSKTSNIQVWIYKCSSLPSTGYVGPHLGRFLLHTSTEPSNVEPWPISTWIEALSKVGATTFEAPRAEVHSR